MQNVLWLARLLPTPINSGDRLYTQGLLRSLEGAGAKLVVFGLADPDGPAPDLGALPSGIEWRLVPGRANGRAISLFSLMPLVAKRFATRSYRRRLRAHLRKRTPDVVVLDHYSMVWAVQALKGRNLPTVIIAHDVETHVLGQIYRDYRGSLLKKAALFLNAVKTGWAEKRLVKAAGLVVTITPADAAAFENLGARAVITITPGYDGPQITRFPDDTERRVVLFGSYRWVAKQMNLRAFLQAADALFFREGIRLDVVGEVPAELRAELQPKLQATTLMGFVDDPSAVFRAARLGVVPEVTGGGFKLKTLDYIFAGLPVAGLSAALEGVPPDVKRHLLVEDDLDGLLRAICEVIDDKERLDTLRRQALAAANTAFDWPSRGKRLAMAMQETAVRR